MKKYIPFILAGAMLMCVVFSGDIICAIRETADLCIYTLIPSLFPFLVFSGMMVLSGSAEYAGRLLHPLTKRLFGISKNGSFLFLLGIICGYPVGAKCISDMIKQRKITLAEGQRLLLFCNNSGPLFVIGSVGYGMYSRAEYGVILYVSHILSVIVTGIVTKKHTDEIHISKAVTESRFFTNSVENAMTTTMNICGYVMFFSAVCTIINNTLPDNMNLIKKALCALSEITGGIKAVSSAYSLSLRAKLIITSFLISFGGICVLFQTKSVISGSGMSIIPYLFAKISQGALSVIFTMLILSRYPLRICAHTSYSKEAFSTVFLFVSFILTAVYFFKLFKKSNNAKKY